MMFSMTKGSDRSGAEAESEAGGGVAKASMPSDEVASAVAAVSDEIVDILKDELGDADSADRIGAELADLGAELGLLAGLADEPQHNFPSIFEIAIGHRGSGSASSSSSWSGARGGRSRRPPRPQRAQRRRPIAKGKEISRRRSAAARRAASMRVRRIEVVSDASDVGADSDSDDQWTEFDDNSGTTDSSSGKDVDMVNIDCTAYQDKGSVEAPAMGQFLLPLLSSEAGPDPEHFLIRHEDILQLLASAEGSVREELPLMDDDVIDSSPDKLTAEVIEEYEEPVVTTEDEAALLHYVCEAEVDSYDGALEAFSAVEEWLLGVYHSWCEISALMYTLVGSGAHVSDSSDWSYRARFGCHCRLCLGLANNERPLRRLLRALVCALAHGGDSALAAHVVRALHLRPGTPRPSADWDLPRLRRLTVSAAGEAIIHEHLTKLAQQNDITGEIVTKICLCRTYDKPLEKENAMERFCKLLENFKTVSTINFKVELVTGEMEAGAGGWAGAVARCLAPHQRRPTAERLAHMAARTAPHDLSAWAGYKHRCDCLTPRTLCAQQRKQLLRISFFGMMQAMNEFNNTRGADEKAPIQALPGGSGRELQQGEGTGAKPPDTTERAVEQAQGSTPDLSDSNITADLDDLSDSGSTGASLGLSSSSLDSASELLVFAAAVEEGAEGGGLCRTVRHLMRSIASIERLMDRVLRHCDEWPAPHSHAPSRNDHEARKRVDLGLSEVDRKLMAMYRRLPEVHKRQLQVYRKQKKLSTVCAQLVGESAPAPPAPASPPPAPASPPPAPAHAPCAALCPEYHLQRFKEVRRKVMHMRDQQLYYHRLRMWLEDQLRQERDKFKANFSVPDTNVTLVEDLPRRKRRTLSPKVPKTITAPKRKLKPTHVSQYISKPHKILQLLKHKAPALSEAIKSPYKEIDDDSNVKSDAEPPEAFPLEKEDNISDTETIVGEKENDICKEMKDCLVKFANFALNAPENAEAGTETKYPESVSPPLQEMSPTTEPTPLFSQKPRILVNKILNRTNEKDDKVIDFNSQVAPDINVPFNARVPVDRDGAIKTKETEDPKDPDAYKYMSFGMEIKKAMEECQNIIISYNKDEKELENEMDGNYSLEQIVEVIMSLDKNTTELLDKMDTDESMELNNANTKLAELVENMPQILANMPEIASKLSEFANASFELPEFASIMNSLPDVNNEAQLTPETLKQIRDLKLSKRDGVKVTKRKINRKVKNSENDLNTMTIEFDGKDITDLLKEDNDLQALMNHKNSKEDLMIKDLLFSISLQVVISKVFEYAKNNKFNNEKDLFLLPRNSIDPEMYNKASILFYNSVKDALSMQELRDIIKSRFNSWKNYVASKFKSIPVEILDGEIKAMLDKFHAYILVLASKQSWNDSDKIIERIDRMRKDKDGSDSDSDGCAAAKESLKLITKILSISAGNTFDLLVMKLSKMSQDKKSSVKNLKFKYIDMVRRCSESQELILWILLDPEIATNVIQELTGLEVREIDNLPDFSTMSNERKKDYFLTKLREMNKQFMQTLPKKALTGDEWLVMLFRLEQLEEMIKQAFAKVATPPKVNEKANERHGASEAEILAAKGLSKIIGKSNFKVANKPNEAPKPVKKEPETEPPPSSAEKDDEKLKNDALLAKCEAILTSKGEKALLDSFYTIKSYITQGLPVPETYKKHVISICSCIDAKLLDEDIEQTLKAKGGEVENAEKDTDKDKSATAAESQNLELDLAKYSALALRNAKQTLNVVAFRNLMRNGQSKSESDACDTPKSNCKWTNDCVCESCKDSDVSVCLGDIMKQWYDEEKTKNGLEEKKKEVKKPIQKVKPVPKMCENAVHPQHVCKAGHGAGAGADEADGDQPCTCCYCTVFGHAPPLTTPVPRNFNETRERLRSILNKKKQKCKTNGEVENEKVAQAASHPTHPVHPTQATTKPPALPKTLPPNLTSATQKQALDTQHKQLSDKMAKMAVSDKQDNKNQARGPVQVNAQTNLNAPATLRTDGRVNPNAMELIRLQQLKQQQLQHVQQQLQQLQYLQQLQQRDGEAPQPQQQPQPHPQQNKPEPIYDLPIHNKPQLTPQQQQQIRQQQQQQQQQQLLRQQQMQQQQLQQHQLQQQQLQEQQQQMQQMQQRQARQQQQPVSLSSRDTSVFSTSSGCSGGSCWRGERAEDPRDLDALLQYIEGPARHVDRGKKKAKKQRQKAKRTEARLLVHARMLRAEVAEGRRAAAALRQAHEAASTQVKSARLALSHTQPRARKKGKKPKLNPEQESNLQLLNKLLGDYIGLVTTTAKELEKVEKRVGECSQQLQQVDRELAETRAILGPQADQENMPQNELLEAYMLTLGDYDEGVKAAVDRGVAALTELLRPSRLNALGLEPRNMDKRAAQKAAEKKQTWEQAVAHINQLAKGSQKEKKKQREQEQKVEMKPKPSPPAPALKPKPVEEPPLSKKQRKLLAKQQAEEEEKRKQQAEKQQKKEKKQQPEPVKESSKKDKKEQKSEPEGKKKKQEQKKENKKQEEKPTKDNKQDKNVQTKNKAKENNKKVPPPAAPGAEKPASCSIMEQLSCGVQVADLRLPPGITLTRVQPAEKKEPAIKSVPLWKCGSLAATPTPPVRPPPVINADPSMLVFSTMPTQPPSRPPVLEPAPQPAGKSKKAKKRAKKAAAAEAEPAPDGPKMVTLRNPMFHPDLPAVQLAAPPAELRVPEPIPMPPTPCQATITPTSNGMYTIRNPLMSLVHRQNMARPPRPAPPPYACAEPDPYAPRADPEPDADFPSRIMNLASFTQKNDEGYSLFKTSDDSRQRGFLAPEYFEAPSPKVVSPNPIGTRPERYEARPEPIGPPLRRDAGGGGGALYTPFGAQDGVFRHAALRPEAAEPADTLPYFQRLRAGSKLNSEVTIHYVTDSKYYKGQDVQPEMAEESLFSRPQPAWTHPNCGAAGSAGGVIGPPRTRAAASPQHVPTLENHVYGERVMDMCERDDYKRFDYFYEPPPHLDMAMRHTK